MYHVRFLLHQVSDNFTLTHELSIFDTKKDLWKTDQSTTEHGICYVVEKIKQKLLIEWNTKNPTLSEKHRDR